MKRLRTMILFDRGDVASTDDWRLVHESYHRSIQSVDFPEGAGSLTLRRRQKLTGGQWNRNGVVYLKKRFFSYMKENEGWQQEVDFDLGEGEKPAEVHLYPEGNTYVEHISSRFGGFDLVTMAPGGTRIAIEWETGNISSSHRSVNKLAIALVNGTIQAGVLIVPSRGLYAQLTDRIGNIGELSGYMPMWQSMGVGVKRGLLAFTVVEQDLVTDSSTFPYLPRGKDGRAREGRAKRR